MTSPYLLRPLRSFAQAQADRLGRRRVDRLIARRARQLEGRRVSRILGRREAPHARGR